MIKQNAFLLPILLCSVFIYSQNQDRSKITEKIVAYKNDIRGPYKDIRWFCTDGSVRSPKDPCPDNIGPGVQHARYKDDVVAIGKDYHIYLGQLL